MSPNGPDTLSEPCILLFVMATRMAGFNPAMEAAIQFISHTAVCWGWLSDLRGHLSMRVLREMILSKAIVV